MSMASPATPTAPDLEGLLRSVGLGGRFDGYGPPDQVVGYLTRRLAVADAECQARFPDGSVRLTLDTVGELTSTAPHKGRAFLEQLFGEGEPAMLVMVWRVLHGADVGRVLFDLEQAARFRLEITLRPDHAGTEERYVSEDVDDSYVVRHFGVGKLNGTLPVLIGFYPSRGPSK